jgi:hypothetical protein
MNQLYNEIKKVGLLGKHGWSSNHGTGTRRLILSGIIEKDTTKYNKLMSALNFQLNHGRKKPQKTIDRIKADINYVKEKFGHLYKPIQIETVSEYGKEFGSKEEFKCYEYLKQKKIPFQFQKSIERMRIDFFLKSKIFIEYHPMNPKFDQTSKRDVYYKKRKGALAKTKYKNHVLLHAISFEEFKNYVNNIDLYINKRKAIHMIKEIIYKNKINSKDDLQRVKNEICKREKSIVMKDDEILDALSPKWRKLFKK